MAAAQSAFEARGPVLSVSACHSTLLVAKIERLVSVLGLVSKYVIGPCGSFNRNVLDLVRLTFCPPVVVRTDKRVVQTIIGKTSGALWCSCLPFLLIGGTV